MNITLKSFLIAWLSVFILYCGYQVATAQTSSTRLLPAEYGYTMTGEPNFTTARLQALYPDAFDPLFPAKGTPPNTDTMAYCLKVHDGDTYRIRYTVTQPDTFDTVETLRLEGVDCDELFSVVHQPFAKIAADSVRGRILGAYLTFRISGRDVYHRTLGSAWLDGKDLGLLILEKGWGQYYPKNTLSKETRKKYQKARDRAKKKKLGRWANPDVIDPAQWRAILKK